MILGTGKENFHYEKKIKVEKNVQNVSKVVLGTKTFQKAESLIMKLGDEYTIKILYITK